jgi:hypothetical protein
MVANLNTLIIYGRFLTLENVGAAVQYFYNIGTCGLYYKTITIVIMMIISDATIWSITFDDASSG